MFFEQSSFTILFLILCQSGGHLGHDHMVVGFVTTYAIGADHY